MKNECEAELCSTCAVRFWCDGTPLNQKSNLKNLIQFVNQIQDPRFTVT